ncbi:NECAP-like protein CG9132 [Ctenocephalides felis]|uniref:NECAP-like protein CG9132 n=1 Tax=Ctenocephalides felis TaxID=7515 RepID=UPI000E6E43D2|nr:NECAP-like protein CG9132 [Ctenocephalides felis]
MDTYESVLLVKSEVFVFKIPARTSNRGYRADDWNLTEPSWTGRMRLVCKGSLCTIKLEDKATGELFAQCPIESYPGIAVEAVTDSSRYFVLRIQDGSGRSAFIGLGFGDRSDSFDFNVALQDHFKWLKKEQEIEKEKVEPQQKLDLGFKENETIKINMKITKKDGSESSKSKPKVGISPPGSSILPPPPGNSSGRIAPPPSNSAKLSPAHKNNVAASGQDWGDFASAASGNAPVKPPAETTTNSNWVQF